MMVTQVSVEYEVLFAVVVLDTLCRSCRLELLDTVGDRPC